MYDEGKKLLSDLIDAVRGGDKEQIDKLKYDNLFYGSSLLTIISNYTFLSDIAIDFDFGFQILKKGTRLYRIRRFEESVNFSDEKEWSYPPSMPENRANRSDEPALYLGTTENICVLETHIGKNEKYVIGEYEVAEDIILGGFLDCEDRKSVRKYLVGVILNAYLIAPSRGDKNRELFDFIDAYYLGYTLEDLQMKEAKELELPLKFGYLNKREEFYKTTNKLLEPIKRKYPVGLSYSSCYIPVVTVGIVCSDTNVVLYKKGMNKIRFVPSTIKTNNSKFNGTDILKLLVIKHN